MTIIIVSIASAVCAIISMFKAHQGDVKGAAPWLIGGLILLALAWALYL